MKLPKLNNILSEENFQELLEKQIMTDLFGNENVLKYNPFKQDEISKKLLLTTIIYCTILIISTIRLSKDKGGNT